MEMQRKRCRHHSLMPLAKENMALSLGLILPCLLLLNENIIVDLQIVKFLRGTPIGMHFCFMGSEVLEGGEALLFQSLSCQGIY